MLAEDKWSNSPIWFHLIYFFIFYFFTYLVYGVKSVGNLTRELYTKGSNKLLLCKVLLGKSYEAKRPMNDLTPAKIKQMGYDSVYVRPAPNLVVNDEFIVYNQYL